MRQKFSRSSRIREGREFTLVREHGKSAQGRFLRVGFLNTLSSVNAKVGIITSKRVGGAVVRNKVRRRIRELVRHSLSGMNPGLLVVVVAKPAAAGASFQELEAEWAHLARRLSLLPSSTA